MTRSLLPLLLTAGLAAGLAACATVSGPANTPAPSQLSACDGGPHCVSSLSTDEAHRIAALVLKAPADKAWAAAIEAVRATERTTIVQGDAHYLHAEVVSPWHFYTDDLELMLRDNGRIEVRSSSRIGYYDFQVNRERIEALREALATKGVVSR